MPMPPALSAAQADEAVLLYTEHEWPTPDIAEHFGVSANAARHALNERGVGMRPKGNQAPPLKVKQCTHCLHFLPMGMFAFLNAEKRNRASWCTPCTAHPTPAPWRTDPQPLTQAVGTWRLQ